MRAFLVIAGVAIGGLGWAGAVALAGPEAAGYVGGALTLGGAFVICMLFSLHARWLGLGGAAVVGLLGAGRNAPVLLELARGAAGPPEWCRLGIMLICMAVFVGAGRALLAERRA